MGEPDEKGVRSLTFELNGKARSTLVEDKSVKGDAKAREKADPSNPLHIGAPIPAMISSIATSVGKAVKKGDKIAVLEAMKMQTTLLLPPTERWMIYWCRWENQWSPRILLPGSVPRS